MWLQHAFAYLPPEIILGLTTHLFFFHVVLDEGQRASSAHGENHSSSVYPDRLQFHSAGKGQPWKVLMPNRPLEESFFVIKTQRPPSSPRGSSSQVPVFLIKTAGLPTSSRRQIHCRRQTRTSFRHVKLFNSLHILPGIPLVKRQPNLYLIAKYPYWLFFYPGCSLLPGPCNFVGDSRPSQPIRCLTPEYLIP